MKRFAREAWIGAVLVALLATLAVVAPAFFQPQPLLSLLAREAPTLVVACGMTLVILTREIDISVGSQFSVCSVVAALLAARGCPLALVVPAAIAAGAVLGAFNGALVAGLGLPSIVVTLASMVTLRQALNLARQGEFVNLPDGVQWLGLSQAGGQILLLAVAALVLVAGAWGLRHLALGRHLYAVGTDAEASRLAGLRPRRVTFGAFVALGALTGLAAMMNIVQSPQVQPLAGSGLELKVIAAVVVGGVAISGGRGRVGGVVLGLILLICVSPALTYLRVEAYWEKAIQGAIILVAVAAENLTAHGRRARQANLT